MATRKFTDDDGNVLEIDDEDIEDDDDEDDGDDGETIELDAEDVKWLKEKRLEEAEARRKGSSSSTRPRKSGTTTGKVVKIRAKQSGASSSRNRRENGRKRVLRIRSA